jgi:class 3 adenylate cyclase
MALEARDALLELSRSWGATEIALHFGIGMATGMAAIGGIGSEGFWDFTIVGTVSNLASRLCAEARAGQILVSRTFFSGIEDRFSAAEIGDVELKGIGSPVRVFNIVSEV